VRIEGNFDIAASHYTVYPTTPNAHAADAANFREDSGSRFCFRLAYGDRLATDRAFTGRSQKPDQGC